MQFNMISIIHLFKPGPVVLGEKLGMHSNVKWFAFSDVAEHCNDNVCTM